MLVESRVNAGSLGRCIRGKHTQHALLPWALGGPQLQYCIRAQAPPAPRTPLGPSPPSPSSSVPQTLPHLVKSPELFDL